MEVSYETTRSWIRAVGEKVIKKIEGRKKVFQNKAFKKAGLDEVWAYVGKRENDIGIWTAISDKDFTFF